MVLEDHCVRADQSSSNGVSTHIEIAQLFMIQFDSLDDIQEYTWQVIR